MFMLVVRPLEPIPDCFASRSCACLRTKVLVYYEPIRNVLHNLRSGSLAMNARTLPIAIGKIVSSNSHIDYVCQVFGRGEIATLPVADDYTFGSFVSIRPEQSATATAIA